MSRLYCGHPECREYLGSLGSYHCNLCGWSEPDNWQDEADDEEQPTSHGAGCRMRKLALMHALMAIGAGLAPAEHGIPMRSERERDKMPRKFTDARKAEAEAKRQRKAEKRAKAVRNG